jgi:hypothetical protein
VIDLEVRRKLAPVVQAKYQESVRKLLDQLKAEANITIVATNSLSLREHRLTGPGKP